MPLTEREVRDQVARLDSLLESIDSLPDSSARSMALDAVQALLQLYGEALSRIVEHAARTNGGELARVLARDELIAHLLLVHGLHPLDLELRIDQALEEVRPYLNSHGGNVQLLGIEKGVARLRLVGSCSGCPSSLATLRMVIEEAVKKAAPDLYAIETVDGEP